MSQKTERPASVGALGRPKAFENQCSKITIGEERNQETPTAAAADAAAKRRVKFAKDIARVEFGHDYWRGRP